MRKATALDPQQRFADAHALRDGLLDTDPGLIMPVSTASIHRIGESKTQSDEHPIVEAAGDSERTGGLPPSPLVTSPGAATRRPPVEGRASSAPASEWVLGTERTGGLSTSPLVPSPASGETLRPEGEGRVSSDESERAGAAADGARRTAQEPALAHRSLSPTVVEALPPSSPLAQPRSPSPGPTRRSAWPSVVLAILLAGCAAAAAVALSRTEQANEQPSARGPQPLTNEASDAAVTVVDVLPADLQLAATPDVQLAAADVVSDPGALAMVEPAAPDTADESKGQPEPVDPSDATAVPEPGPTTPAETNTVAEPKSTPPPTNNTDHSTPESDRKPKHGDGTKGDDDASFDAAAAAAEASKLILSQPKRAAELLARALRVEPKQVRWRFDYARALDKLERFCEARTAYQRALDDGLSGPYAARARTRVEELAATDCP